MFLNYVIIPPTHKHTHLHDMTHTERMQPTTLLWAFSLYFVLTMHALRRLNLCTLLCILTETPSGVRQHQQIIHQYFQRDHGMKPQTFVPTIVSMSRKNLLTPEDNWSQEKKNFNEILFYVDYIFSVS